MVNRRLLRIKAMQVLYAQLKNTDKTIATAESELKYSIGKSYELYLLVFNLLRNFRARAEIRCEYLKTLPLFEKETYDKLIQLAENPFFIALSESKSLDSGIDAYPLSWDENSTDTATFFQAFIDSEQYTKFLAKENTFSSGKKLADSYLTENLLADEEFHSILEEINVYWNDDLAFVFVAVEKTIRRFKVGDTTGFLVLPLFTNPDDESFGLRLVRKTIATAQRFDDRIRALARNWEFDRISDMDLLIIRLGLIEAVEFPYSPEKVLLNEYIDMANFYSSEKSGSFINSILHRIYTDLQADGELKMQIENSTKPAAKSQTLPVEQSGDEAED